jgi:hypothetical protein
MTHKETGFEVGQGKVEVERFSSSAECAKFFIDKLRHSTTAPESKLPTQTRAELEKWWEINDLRNKIIET